MGQCSDSSYVTVWRLSARAERQLLATLSTFPSATATAAVVVRPSRRRVLKALQALLLQALHLAYKAGPFASCDVYDVPAWASGRPSRVVAGCGGLICSRSDHHGHRR